ncbi:hypothetical protein [Lactobacillus sp. 3B(2020)]|uniref:hypothetical protein n=1 Tax=Lactobacillus sp. 3B(2020) TaxID=2695882 RepID=UPI0015DFE011|nr:hypothetical protein [Lactobacillus sp. 3B(2020)]QLL70237.1 hypothetical protein GTO83_06660 [Lactobacillus sp. 3B(2020)]
MSNNDELTSTVHFHISGNGFDPKNGYNLKYLIASLNSVQNIIEKTYTFVSEKERFTNADESNLQIKITDIKPGSFQADLQILMGSIILPVTDMLQLSNPKQLWTLATQCYNYVHDLLKAKSKGERIKVETNNSERTVNIINEGSGTVNVYPAAVPELSRKLSSNFNQLNSLVANGGPVSDISIVDTSSKDNNIQVNEESSRYFVKQTLLNDEIQVVNGVIYKIDATKFTGNIFIKEGNDLIGPGKYKFSFIDKDELTIDDMKRVLMTESKFRCLAKTRIDPSNLKEDVIELKIIKIENYEAA